MLSLGTAAVILLHLASFGVAILLVKQFEGSRHRGGVLSLQVGTGRGFHILGKRFMLVRTWALKIIVAVQIFLEVGVLLVIGLLNTSAIDDRSCEHQFIMVSEFFGLIAVC